MVSDFLGSTVNECLFCTQSGETMSSWLVGQPHVRSLQLWRQQRLQLRLQQDYWRMSLQGFFLNNIHPNCSEPFSPSITKCHKMSPWLSLQSISFPQDNYYRPKDGDTCFPCDCFHLGASSRSCDPETGQCPCKAGVIGRQCNRCDNPFSEVTSTGCEGMYPLGPALSLNQRCGNVHLH